MISGKIKLKNMGFELGCKNIVYVKNIHNNMSCSIIIPHDRMSVGRNMIKDIVSMFQEVSSYAGSESLLNVPTLICHTSNTKENILISSYFHSIRISSIEKLKAIGLSSIDFEYANLQEDN